MSSDNDTLPFFLWPLIGGVVVAVLFFIKLMLPPHFEEAFLEFSRQRLAAFSQKATAPRIVAIGTSRTLCATYLDKEMENFYSASYPSPIHFLRMTRNGGFLAAFGPLFSQILAVSPDIILVEPSVFFYRWETPHELFPRKVFKEKIKSCLRGDVFAKKLYWDEEITRPETAPQTHAYFVQQVNLWKRLQKFLTTSPWVHLFLEEAKNRGIRVVLLDIPASQRVEESLKQEEDLKREKMAYLQKTYNVEIWRFEKNDRLDHYLDFTHLNLEGQREFSQWLCERLHACL